MSWPDVKLIPQTINLCGCVSVSVYVGVSMSVSVCLSKKKLKRMKILVFRGWARGCQEQ